MDGRPGAAVAKEADCGRVVVIVRSALAATSHAEYLFQNPRRSQTGRSTDVRVWYPDDDDDDLGTVPSPSRVEVSHLTHGGQSPRVIEAFPVFRDLPFSPRVPDEAVPFVEMTRPALSCLRCGKRLEGGARGPSESKLRFSCK
jgi:hypothetical protein